MENQWTTCADCGVNLKTQKHLKGCDTRRCNFCARRPDECKCNARDEDYYDFILRGYK
jgi:hypothetical protein